MKRKAIFAVALAFLLALVGCGRKDDGIVRESWSHTYNGFPVVYISPEVSAQSLVSVFRSLEVSAAQSAAIKLSDTKTDAGFVWTDLIGELSQVLDNSIIAESYAALSDYDYSIVLSHFRSHSVVGFNGAMKQTAIISAPLCEVSYLAGNQNVLETLVKNGKHTMDQLDGKILYINVMDRLSIEISGIILPESNPYNIGILASYDPVALDQACVDMIYLLQEGKSFAAQIEACNGTHTLAYAEKTGLGSRTYALSLIENG